MIKIENLTFTYPGAASPALKNISLEVEKGDFLAIVGSNGCGKSTLCKTLNGLIPHFFSGDFAGSVKVNDLDTREHKVGELAFHIGYVYQDFENQIVRPTVLDDASFACLNYAMEDYLTKGRDALRMAGLSGKEKDYVWQLSGGQKHLLALAGVLALSPDILLLDEPIAQLDPKHAREIYDVLKELNEVYKKTILVIEHHMEFVAEYCKNMVMMKQGEVLFKLPVKEGLNRVEELEENNIYPPQVTIAAKRLRDKGVIKKEKLLPTTIEEGKEYFLEGLLGYSKGYKKGYFHESKKCKEEKVKKDAVVSFQNITVEYRVVKGEKNKILDNFSVDIHRKEKVALIGNNGAGKSTLLKLITGSLKPKEGDVLVCGLSAKELATEEMSSLVSFVYQNPEEMFIKDSIHADIAYAMKSRGIREYKKRTEDLLSMFHLKELEERDGRLLSGGQMRRASLAIGIALNPKILLLDEPTANLDIATRKEIMKTLDIMKEEVETVMIATHDMQLVSEWADRILVLNNGRIIADGTREEIFNNRAVIELAGITPPAIYTLGKEIQEEGEYFTVETFLQSFEKFNNIKMFSNIEECGGIEQIV